PRGGDPQTTCASHVPAPPSIARRRVALRRRRPPPAPCAWRRALGARACPVARAYAHLGALEGPAYQPVEPYAGGVGRLREQARLGQAGDRVELEHVQVAGGLLEHEVDAGKPGAPHQRIDLERERRRRLGDVVGQLGRTEKRRATDLVT